MNSAVTKDARKWVMVRTSRSVINVAKTLSPLTGSLKSSHCRRVCPPPPLPVDKPPTVIPVTSSTFSYSEEILLLVGLDCDIRRRIGDASQHEAFFNMRIVQERAV
jgi:hypothetical protein